MARRTSQKLSFRFFGPYRVEAKVGAVAYKLSLPPSSALHPVFHVSQLKRSHGDHLVTETLPSENVQFQVPQRLLQHRWTSGDQPVEEVLIQWSQMPPSLATWELLESLRQQFPRAPAWGHAGTQEGGNVSTRAVPGSQQSAETSQDKGESPSAARPKRNRKLNPLTSGPEWLSQ